MITRTSFTDAQQLLQTERCRRDRHLIVRVVMINATRIASTITGATEECRQIIGIHIERERRQNVALYNAIVNMKAY